MDAPQVVEHEDRQEGGKHDRERGTDRRLRATVEVEVDLVADQRRLRRARDDVRCEVVAEHRQGDEDGAPENADLREREGDLAKRIPGARTEVTCRLQVATVDAIERGEERQDQVWDV